MLVGGMFCEEEDKSCARRWMANLASLKSSSSEH